MEKMIFVVDDNDANLTLAAMALENDYRVLTMPSAEKMLKLISKKRPDLILLDIEMPGMDGFEAIVKLKEDPELNSIPVMFLTGHSDEKVLNKAKELGGLDILYKPFVPSELLSRINSFFSQKG